MPYATINAVEYMVEEGSARGTRLLIENRRRALDASLLVDRITTKTRKTWRVTGLASAGTLFTPAEADAFLDTITADADLTVSGEVVAGQSLTMRASDVGTVEQTDFTDRANPVIRVFVEATYEET